MPDGQQKPSASASFSSCTFTHMSSSSNGSAIYFTCGGSLTVRECSFLSCSHYISSNDDYSGGGAIHVNPSSQLTVTSSNFIDCSTTNFGGGILAHRDCTFSTVSLCTFVKCRARVGAGLMSYKGTVSSVVSCFFISGTGTATGGGLYHDGTSTGHSISISESIFATNTAYSEDNRGGGAFEDHRQQNYTSHYSFSFFTGNAAVNTKGHDISIPRIRLSIDAIIHCFTTTQIHSFWNQDDYQDTWLPLTNSNVDLSPYATGNNATHTYTYIHT